MKVHGILTDLRRLTPKFRGYWTILCPHVMGREGYLVVGSGFGFGLVSVSLGLGPWVGLFGRPRGLSNWLTRAGPSEFPLGDD